MDSDFWKNKRVLITGHSGFVGSWLCLRLHKMGANLSGYSLPPLTNPNLFMLAGLDRSMDSVWEDIRDLSQLEKALQRFKPEIVFHLAAQSQVLPSYADPIGTYSTNVMGTVNILQACRNTDFVRAVINMTSDKCYENQKFNRGYQEEDALGGSDPYSSSKACSELITAAMRGSYFQNTKVGLASARVGNIIGGGDWSENRLIPNCIRALTEGNPIPIRHPDSSRPWQHILEALTGLFNLTQRLYTEPETYSRPWNFGPLSSSGKTVKQVAEYLTQVWASGAQWVEAPLDNAPHETQTLILDSTLARSRLSWPVKLTLEKTLDWTAQWYLQHAVGEAPDKLCFRQIEEYESLPAL